MLKVEGLEVRYGRLTALRGVSLHVERGETVCLIGPNGAGKSTLFACIAGGVSATHGSVTLDGKRIAGRRPEQIARSGLSLVPEGRNIFKTLTVEENLRLGAFMAKDRESIQARLDEVMAHFPRLAERFRSSAGSLSGGEQQMLAIGRALMTGPRIMLVDEPSLGLAPKIVDQVYEILMSLRDEKALTLLINEQSSKRALRHANRIYVLRSGEMRLEGRAEDLQDGEAVMRAYFGFDERREVGEAAQ
ncbi:amino acid/amide ABC transporter ATP-binding protein 2 (HAAT family) [Roseiarcus fermentans]|uniref:Amino acid/amide ABC transporter ATP-binding protein 2 (HAAT family) n=1 Tax=Roseiarcus fermentans TaxID=1473586 RepID=A0A366FH51_9HYPH|nr:ABC transporter ATP-binding protein [Roseiarcus fermentans]RBP14003.1 amino acid/amide ABC transporter ATP-binding protein 2 (HAAT family) [Roseiarcus fermentans]